MSKFSLYGCERDDLNYAVAKCGFILNNIPLTNLIHNSCFNTPYE